MPDMTIEVEIYCAKCGDGLCNQTEFWRTPTRGEPSFRVEPCERCLEAEYERGREAGIEEMSE